MNRSSIIIIRTSVVIPKHFLSSNSPVPDVGTAYLHAMAKKNGFSSFLLDAAGEGLEIYNSIKNTDLLVQGLTAKTIVSRIPKDIDYIAVSCTLSNCWIYDSYILKKIKQQFPNKKIIIGGEHTTATYDYILKNHLEVDICVLGEGEDTFIEVLTTLENAGSLESVKGIAYLDSNKKVIVTEKRNRINQLENIPWPNWDTVPLDKYFNINQGINSNYKKSMIMLATRGCPYACGFCTNDIMWNSKWIARDAGDVVKEIKHYATKYGVDNIDFVDLTLMVNREWMFKFCKLLIEENLGITWTIPIGTRTEGLDYNLLQVMKKSGLIRLMYAAESGSRNTLNRIDKCLVINKFNKVVKETIKLKIDVKINYILGFPGQNLSEAFDSLKLLIKLAFWGVNDLITLSFVPYPGTKLYKEIDFLYDYSDPYFYIPLNNDIKNPTSWSEHFSNRQLKYLVIFFNGFFYSLQFIFRPYRIIISFYRVFISKKPHTNFETIFFNFFKRKDAKTGIQDLSV